MKYLLNGHHSNDIAYIWSKREKVNRGGTSILRAHFACRSSDQTLLVASGQNESAPETGALPNFNQSEPQAATLVGLTSKSLLELVIGIARGFIASGISRTRLTCRSPFSRLAPLTLT